MDGDIRRDPDEILRQITEAETGHGETRGKLKIFFGYAAGVGKTYAMLEDAHIVLAKGYDVVVGYVEPHTRADTLALLEGLEQIPPREIHHKGITLHEFDLDAALERHPQVLIVDELAHSNAPGSRHKKRFQDVEELLRAGINVYTTVNAQHLEGLNDKIAAITEVSVAERIPDYLFDHAASVELIDIEPDDLIERLESGKIYVPDRARTALANFFSKKNLAALREITLRRMADRMTRNVDASEVASRPETGEDVLVYTTSEIGNVKAIRAAANMAEAYHGNLTALVVETTSNKHITAEERQQLRSNITLAEELGAHVVTLYGDDVASQIIQYASTAGIGQIVVGTPALYKKSLRAANSLVNRLMRLSSGAIINAVPTKNLPQQLAGYLPQAAFKITAGDVWKALAAVALAGIAGVVFDIFGLSPSIILMAYMLIVLLFATWADSFFYSFFASLGSMLTYNFFFTEPRFSLDAYGWSSPFIFLFILLATMLASSLTIRLKRQTLRATRRAYRTEILLESNRKLQSAADVKGCVQVLAEQIIKLVDSPVALYLTGAQGKLGAPKVFGLDEPGGAGFSRSELIDSSEQAVAAWVAANNESAGATTDTLGESTCLYLPIRGTEKVFGVAGIAIKKDHDDLEAFEKNLLLAIIDEGGQAIERAVFEEDRHSMEFKVEKESLRSNLLRSISHDLRTPLTSISGDADVLVNEGEKLTDVQKSHMYQDIYEDSTWLISLVENLLSVTRIDEGSLQVSLQPELIADVIQEALAHVSRKAADYSIKVDLEDELLMASMDAKLIMQVIINLVNNAVMHTPKGSTIIIAARRDSYQGKKLLRVSVSDNGPGIPEASKTSIFDMMYRVPLSSSSDATRGLGLGLALCRSIIRVHGSDIHVRDVEPHGSEFFFTLPLVEAADMTAERERESKGDAHG